jgi:hypothetical protein
LQKQRTADAYGVHAAQRVVSRQILLQYANKFAPTNPPGAGAQAHRCNSLSPFGSRSGNIGLKGRGISTPQGRTNRQWSIKKNRNRNSPEKLFRVFLCGFHPFAAAKFGKNISLYFNEALNSFSK